MNATLRLLNTLLLIAILATLLLIWRRMPPTLEELKGTKGEVRKAMLLRRPYIQSEIDDPIQIDTTTPLQVEVTNDVSVSINQ